MLVGDPWFSSQPRIFNVTPQKGVATKQPGSAGCSTGGGAAVGEGGGKRVPHKEYL